MFREIEGGHRLELKDINCENWLKLRGGKNIFFGGGANSPLKKLNSLYSSNILSSIFSWDIKFGKFMTTD